MGREVAVYSRMVAIISLLGAWQVQSCRGDEPVSAAKFITDHGLSLERMANWYLIHAVKQPAWKIHYGFSDNNRCQSSGIADEDDFDRQLRDSIVRAVQLWLQPLRDGGDVLVDTFDLQLQDTVAVRSEMAKGMGATREVALARDDPPHFRITFNCMRSEGKGEYPRSFILMGNSPHVFMFHYRKPAKNCVAGNTGCEGRDQREIFPHDKMSSEHMFMMTTLIHELGHAFGLKDVYVEISGSTQSKRQGINYSTGGSDRTVGKQPNSMMGVASIIGLRGGEFVITTDDEEAIKWLYLQAHGGAALGTCPTDYEMEKETDGCVPRFPLIFAVREGDLRLARTLLDDGNVDLDSCDRYGNTALFYAQQGQHGHGQAMVKLLNDAGADPDAECPAAAQPQASSQDQVRDSDDSQADSAAPSSKLTDFKKKLSCGTLAHPDVAGNKLLLLLLLLPALLPFPLSAAFFRR